MANTDATTIQIIDESSSAGYIKHQLYIDGGRRAAVIKRNGIVSLNWQVYGPQGWPEAKNLIQGLLELSVIADSLLSGGLSNGKKIN